jgi:hypothetical protein
MVAVGAVSTIFRLVFIILNPIKISIPGDEPGAELPESSFPTLPNKE